jgi:UDP-3-O-[3-hydroxymyristoyl] glucosamine N-acyltransferase
VIHWTAIVGEPAEHRDVIWAYYERTWDEDCPVPVLEPEIDPTAIVGALCTVDAGIQQPTRIGARTLLMKRVHVGHDAQIGAGCEIGAGVVICGEVEIGDDVRIGGNAWIKPKKKIGDGARIGGGAVVTKDVPAGEVWAGNPARLLRKSPANEPDLIYACVP